jgi:hypothetical protein
MATKNSTFFSGHPMDAAAKTTQQFQIMDGQLINPVKTPKRAAATTGLSVMINQGIIPRGSPHGSTNLMMETFLSTQTCSVSSERKKFSLLSNQTDAETIDNPHILSRKDYEMIEIDYIEATDKFTNPSDPFYTPDDPKSQSVTKQKHKTKQQAFEQKKTYGDLTQIGSYMVQINSAKTSKGKNKYFDNDDARMAIKRSKF